jgi:hypothetical protein
VVEKWKPAECGVGTVSDASTRAEARKVQELYAALKRRSSTILKRVSRARHIGTILTPVLRRVP